MAAPGGAVSPHASRSSRARTARLHKDHAKEQTSPRLAILCWVARRTPSRDRSAPVFSDVGPGPGSAGSDLGPILTLLTLDS